MNMEAAMNAKEKDLCDRMQERIEEGMMTTLEHELFVAWIEALNRIKNLEVALDDRDIHAKDA